MKVEGGTCFQCKGRLWCGLGSCPLLEKVRIQLPLQKKLSTEVFGPTPPNVFVGSYDYPNVFVGPLVGVVDGIDASLCDSPRAWYGASYEEIIRFRSSLARGMSLQHVKQAAGQSSKLVSDLQESVLSTAPVDLEVRFKSVPRYQMRFSSTLQPMGPSAEIKDLSVVENPRVPKKVDEVVEEGLRVNEALPELVSGGFDYYYLQKLLSAGVLGKKADRKLVPTRWAITATDDLLAKLFLKEVRGFPEVNEFRLYSNEYLYNHFEVLLLPGKWEFEQFEAWAPGSVWMAGSQQGGAPGIAHEYEPFEGRSDYAETEAGGYYAGRFGVVEALHKIGRQARCVVFREIGEQYKLPVGVFEVRENVRHAFEKPATKFGSLKEAFDELRGRLRNPLENYLAKSVVLRQKRLTEF